MKIEVEENAYKNAEVLFLQEEPEFLDEGDMVSKVLRKYTEDELKRRSDRVEGIKRNIENKKSLFESPATSPKNRERIERDVFVLNQELELIKSKLELAQERMIEINLNRPMNV